MTYTLYHAKGACSLAIKAALTLAKVDFETVTVDLASGEHLKPDYKKINPFSKVPALKMDDWVLTEGMAMHLTISERFADAGLFPSNVDRRANAYRWLSFIYSGIHPLFSILFITSRYANDTKDARKKAADSIIDAFHYVDNELQQHNYIAGENLTSGDLYLLVQLHWADSAKLGLFDKYPTLKAYMDRMHAHPVIGALYKNEFGYE